MTVELIAKITINRVHDSDDIIGLKEAIAEAVGDNCSYIEFEEIKEPFAEQRKLMSREIGGGRTVSEIIDDMRGMTIAQLRAVTDGIIQLSMIADN